MNTKILNPNLDVVITNNGKPSLMVNVDGHEIKLNGGSSPKPKNLIIEYVADSKPNSKWIDENCVDNIFDGSYGQLILKKGLTVIEANDNEPNIFNDRDKKGNVKKVDIPLGITYIGYGAFSNSHGLQSVTIPNSVTCIGNNAFYLCKRLTTINIPDSVTNIDSYAFTDCGELTSIVIPQSVTSISHNAFDGCSSLSYVKCEALEPPLLGEYAFNAIVVDAILQVPQNSLEQYKQSAWNDYFADIDPIED